MYFLYDLAQFRPNPPVHLLQEQLWHSLTSLPQKTCQQKIDPQTPSNHLVKRSKKTSENLRSLWRKALKRRFNKVSNSITDFFTRTKSPISGRHEFSEKNPWELWVNFQQAFRWGSLGNDVKIDYLQCTDVPSRHPINTFWDEHLLDNLLPSHLFRRLRDVGIAKKALNLSCIIPATQKRCKVLLGRLKCTWGPTFHWLSELEILTDWEGLFWNISNGMMATYGT